MVAQGGTQVQPPPPGPTSAIPTEIGISMGSATSTRAHQFTTTSDNSAAPTSNSVEPHISLTESGPNSNSSSNGLPTPAKIGIGVGIAILLILIGGALLLFIRRKKQQRLLHEKSGVGEEMIGGGKVHLDEDLSSEPSPAAHSGTPPQAPDGHMYAPPAMQGGYGQGEVAVPVVAPVARRSVDEEDFMHRPVSPVHDDDLMTEVAPVHTAGRSATALGGSIRERGSPTLDHVDGEMEWILEEERKARERREKQGRLPHGPSSSSS